MSVPQFIEVNKSDLLAGALRVALDKLQGKALSPMVAVETVVYLVAGRQAGKFVSTDKSIPMLKQEEVGALAIAVADQKFRKQRSYQASAVEGASVVALKMVADRLIDYLKIDDTLL